jgi:hypothetical protein
VSFIISSKTHGWSHIYYFWEEVFGKGGGAKGLMFALSMNLYLKSRFVDSNLIISQVTATNYLTISHQIFYVPIDVS